MMKKNRTRIVLFSVCLQYIIHRVLDIAMHRHCVRTLLLISVYYMTMYIYLCIYIYTCTYVLKRRLKNNCTTRRLSEAITRICNVVSTGRPVIRISSYGTNLTSVRDTTNMVARYMIQIRDEKKEKWSWQNLRELDSTAVRSLYKVMWITFLPHVIILPIKNKCYLLSNFIPNVVFIDVPVCFRTILSVETRADDLIPN